MQLFLMKNLLVLREQVAAFDGYFVHNEQVLDFQSVAQVLWTFINPTTLLSFADKVKTVESYADAKENLDLEVKRVCEEYISDATKTTVEPLSSFLLKVRFELPKSELKFGRRLKQLQSYRPRHSSSAAPTPNSVNKPLPAPKLSAKSTRPLSTPSPPNSAPMSSVWTITSATAEPKSSLSALSAGTSWTRTVPSLILSGRNMNPLWDWRFRACRMWRGRYWR